MNTVFNTAGKYYPSRQPVKLTQRMNSPMSQQMEKKMRVHLENIISQSLLTVLFQSIANLGNGTIFGYNGLIRGPADSPLHSPVNLFNIAAQLDLTTEIEHLCRRAVLDKFSELGLPGKLFLNINPQSLSHIDQHQGETLAYMNALHLEEDRVVIEVAECVPSYDFNLLHQAGMHYRLMGFEIALDSFADGFSNQPLWAESPPDYIIIDFHVIQDIGSDQVKQDFVRSIQEEADKTGTQVIAKGIETQRDLLLLRDMGIAFGQGFHISRPTTQPALALPAEVTRFLSPPHQPLHSVESVYQEVTVEKLLIQIDAVSPDTPNKVVFEKFNADNDLHALPVVINDIPVGLINRQTILERMVRPFRQEVFGKKPCSQFMDAAPLIVDKNLSIQEVSTLIVRGERHHLTNGFIITENGYYRGIGSGHDLMSEITTMQITLARQANPLTQLPGNIPINQRIEKLLENGTDFHACYCDLNHFKPFNDVYGFHKGDEVIRLTADILKEHSDPVKDFIGHVGGDDFIVLFQSEDWENRCNQILQAFATGIQVYFSVEDRERGGYVTEDRQGKKTFQALTSLALGVVKILPEKITSLHQVSALASSAKKHAKKMTGNALFVERRDYQTSPAKDPSA